MTIPRGDKADTEIVIISQGGQQIINIHTSCSRDLFVGDRFGGLTIIGYDGLIVCTTNSQPVIAPQSLPTLDGDNLYYRDGTQEPRLVSDVPETSTSFTTVFEGSAVVTASSLRFSTARQQARRVFTLVEQSIDLCMVSMTIIYFYIGFCYFSITHFMYLFASSLAQLSTSRRPMQRNLVLGYS